MVEHTHPRRKDASNEGGIRLVGGSFDKAFPGSRSSLGPPLDQLRDPVLRTITVGVEIHYDEVPFDTGSESTTNVRFPYTQNIERLGGRYNMFRT